MKRLRVCYQLSVDFEYGELERKSTCSLSCSNCVLSLSLSVCLILLSDSNVCMRILFSSVESLSCVVVLCAPPFASCVCVLPNSPLRTAPESPSRLPRQHARVSPLSYHHHHSLQHRTRQLCVASDENRNTPTINQQPSTPHTVCSHRHANAYSFDIKTRGSLHTQKHIPHSDTHTPTQARLGLNERVCRERRCRRPQPAAAAVIIITTSNTPTTPPRQTALKK